MSNLKNLIEQDIEKIKGKIFLFKSNIQNLETELAEAEKDLEKLKLNEFNSFHRRIILDSYGFTLNNITSEEAEKLNLEDKFHALVIMIDLCDKCNSRFPKKSDVHYHLNHDKLGDSLFSYEYFYNTKYSHVIFNSEESVDLAISMINKSESLTKFAKIFLGVSDES